MILFICIEIVMLAMLVLCNMYTSVVQDLLRLHSKDCKVYFCIMSRTLACSFQCFIFVLICLVGKFGGKSVKYVWRY